MPARDQLVADSRRTQIRIWFATHPGWHSPSALYGAFPDDDRQTIRNEVKRLADATDGVIRYRRPGAAPKGPGTKYARPGTNPPEE